MQQKIELDSGFVNDFWQDKIIPALSDFIRIPAISPAYDEKWQANGHINDAAKLFVDWAKAQNIKGLTAEVIQLKGKTPVVYVEIPATNNSGQTALCYGHLDKMPSTQQAWDKDKGPWQPVLQNDRLYGRGSVDNGYAFFTFIGAIKLLQQQGIAHSKCIILIEASEESGSFDLPDYFDHLANRFGTPDLVLCLDAGAHDYERIWCTNSLRGLVDGILEVSVLESPVHSGTGTGICPDSFRILRQLLDRIEDKNSGKLLLKTCYTDIPNMMRDNAKELAKFLGENVYKELPFLSGVQPVTYDVEELLLNSTWKPALCIVGAEGFPPFKDAINVVRPSTSVQLSLRIPPGCIPEEVIAELKNVLEKDPPYGAKVTFTPGAPCSGWSFASIQPWLKASIENVSKMYFGHAPIYGMEGGSIGTIALLGEKFPKAQFFISGLLSAPGANEHAPNESLYIPAAKKMTLCVAHILYTQQC
jgi:acetylornithine deacetylase/succinyl-diaminopimelate desuccinylase-like protein